MINAAAMLGLQNDPALKELGQVKIGIQTLFKIKEKDYAEMRRESRRQKEQDKREAQDVSRILNSEARELEKIKDALKTSQGGLMAALLGGAALLGAIGIVKGFNIVEFIGDLKDRLVDLFQGGTIPKEPSADDNPAAAEKPTGTDEDEELGDVSDLQPADPNFKGIAAPDTIGITSPLGMRGGRLHAGVDIGGAGGEKLTVSRPSVVVESRWYSGYGNTVIFKDNRGEQLYAHMQSLSKFKKGDTVQPGEVIGRLGNTGNSTGPHLHWEYSPRLGEVGTPGRKLKNVSDPTKSAGMNWKTPFTGKQTGGAIGKATHYIRDHEALASLTPGKWDWIKPVAGAKSYATKKPWESVNDNTPIYPYRDRGAKKTPTIGWGTTWLNGMMSGQNPVTMSTPAMPKKKADEHLTKDVASLTNHLAKTISYWKHLTESQKAGFISIGYNAGQNAHITKSTSKFFPYRDAIKSGNLNRVISPDVMPHYKERNSRRKDEINMLKDGPMDYSKHVKKQRGGFIGKKSGGIVNQAPVHKFQSGGNVAKTGKTPELYEKYNDKFIGRQARKATSTSIIIVNNITKAASTGAPNSKKGSPYIDPGGGEPSYSDIAQSYYRYVGGIKV